MFKLISVIYLCMQVQFLNADYCQENFTIAELPGGIREEVISILLTGTVGVVESCPGNIEVPDEDVKFWFFNRNNPDIPILLDPKNPTEIDPKKPIKVLVPGWLCNVTNDHMPNIRNAYLKREDCNVIGIDWTAHSIDLYGNSFCAIPGVAKIVARLLCSLPIDLKTQVHIIGHSMGGQIAGITGYQVQQQCKTSVARITGLDPAGPLYQTTLLKKNRLDKSDAKFVDVIHTNQMFFGFYGPCGDADFYPNCGTFQPGCAKIDNSTSLGEILAMPLSEAGCSHFRATNYMTESINPGDETFVATSCLTCPGAPLIGPCWKDIIGKKYTVMGEDCPANPPASSFTLATNDEAPFAQG